MHTSAARMPNYKGRKPGTRRITIFMNGRQREWVIRGTKADGDAFEARKRLELQEQETVATRVAPRFCELCSDHYRVHAEQHLKASTWKKVRVYQVATLAEWFGRKRLVDIRTADIDRFKAARLQDGASPVSINNELRVLHRILRWAKEDRGFPVSDAKIRKLPVHGQSGRTPWTREELQRLFDAAREVAPQLLPMLIFLANTGCRKGEAIAAEWSWADFDRSLIRIPSNEVWQPKNRKPRDIPMSDAVRAILTGPRASERWLFPNRHGGRYAEFPKDLFWKVREKAGLTGGVHTLRHTFASHFLEAIPDLFLLAKILGHSHTRVTEIYSHLLPDHLNRARNAVNFSPTLVPALAAREKPAKKPEKVRKRH